MSLLGGDLTTLARVKNWSGNAISGTGSDVQISQLIPSCTAAIYNKLNRSRLFSQTFTRYFDGQGTYQLVLPDYPVTGLSSLQIDSVLVPANPLPAPNQSFPPGINPGYGYRIVTLGGNDVTDTPSVIELNGCGFRWGYQNVKVVYTAGFLIASEPQTVPGSGPYTTTVNQFNGIWCRDNGVINSLTGAALTPVAGAPGSGQYTPPTDTTIGVYTFNAAQANTAMLISYSYIPSDLEEACIQYIRERMSYSGRIGELSKSLAGQETISFLRGGGRRSRFDLPPEVESLISSYVSVIPPAIGAPV